MRGDQRPKRRPARRVGGVRTNDRDRSNRGRCDQASAYRGADHRRARAIADNRAAQRRISFFKQRNQAKCTDQLDCDRAVIPESCGVDSEGDVIEPITIERGDAISAKSPRL